MKKCTILFLYIMAASRLSAQQVPAIKWLQNYSDAVSISAKEKRPVLLFFHGSDWCPPCMQMQKDVLSDTGFIFFSADKIIFLDVDFPRKPPLTARQLKHNEALKKLFGLPDEFTQGYPQVVIIDAAGKVLYQEKGYAGEGPAKLTAVINNLKIQIQ